MDVFRLPAAQSAPAGGWTVGTWMTRHWAELEASGSRSTAFYRGRWARFGASLDAVPLRDVDPAAVYAWTLGLRAERTIFGGAPSAAYVRSAFGVLNAAMIAAVASGLLTHNPCAGLRRYLPRRAPALRGKRRVVQADEIARLLTSDAIPWLSRRLYAGAFYLGLRAGEVCGLEFQDLHLTAPVPFAHIARSWDGETKTASSERDVPIHPEFMEYFLSPLVKHGWASNVKRPWRPTDPVFSTRTGTHYRTRRLAHGLDLHFCKLGILDGCTFHGLRHSAGTLWADAGIDERTIETLLGHAPSQTRHYARPSLARLGAEIRRFSLLNTKAVDTGSAVDITLTTLDPTEETPMAPTTRPDPTKSPTRSSCSSPPPSTEQRPPAGVKRDALAAGFSEKSADALERAAGFVCAWCGGPIPPLGNLSTDAIIDDRTGEHFCSGPHYQDALRNPTRRFCVVSGKRVELAPVDLPPPRVTVKTWWTPDGLGLRCRACGTLAPTRSKMRATEEGACSSCRFTGGPLPAKADPLLDAMVSNGVAAFNGDDVRDELVPPAARGLGGSVPKALALADAFDLWDAAAQERPFDEAKIERLGRVVAEKLAAYRLARGAR